MAKVKFLIEVEFEAADEAAINSAAMRLQNDMKTSLEFGKIPGVPTGIKKGVRVEITKKEMQ